MPSRGIDRYPVQRPDLDLTEHFTPIRIDDEERLASCMRGIDAASLRIDRDVVKSAENRNWLRRQHR